MYFYHLCIFTTKCSIVLLSLSIKKHTSRFKRSIIDEILDVAYHMSQIRLLHDHLHNFTNQLCFSTRIQKLLSTDYAKIIVPRYEIRSGSPLFEDAIHYNAIVEKNHDNECRAIETTESVLMLFILGSSRLPSVLNEEWPESVFNHFRCGLFIDDHSWIIHVHFNCLANDFMTWTIGF